MTFRKSAALFIMTAVFFCACEGAFASNTNNTYMLSIPADFEITTNGRNNIGTLNIKGSGDKGFIGEKVYVTATSANGFKMVSGNDSIQYTFTDSYGYSVVESGGFVFRKSDINTDEGVSEALFINITWDSNQPAGQYTDTIIYTTEVPPYWDGDLAKLTNDSTIKATATDGMTIYGTLGADVCVEISIEEDATVTFSDAIINGNGTNYDTSNYPGITCKGDATIILSGDNTVRSFFTTKPGIYIPEGFTLTIKGDGSLTASSAENEGERNGAGIGSDNYEDSGGNIVIESGTITAYGGRSSAGIGSSNNSSCGSITISGGTVTATGGENAAGIGSGYQATCQNITITGGSIEATGGYAGAGIGSGKNGSCGNINIASTVTSVTATKGEDAPNSIGAGDNGSCGEITIETGANVTKK